MVNNTSNTIRKSIIFWGMGLLLGINSLYSFQLPSGSNSSDLLIKEAGNRDSSSEVLTPFVDSQFTITSESFSVNTSRYTDYVIYKGYSIKEIEEEIEIIESLLPYLEEYYGVKFDANLPNYTELLDSWSRMVAGGIIAGNFPLEDVQKALNLVIVGEASLDNFDVLLPFVEYYRGRGRLEDYTAFWERLCKEYGFTPDEVLSNRIIPLSYGAWQRDPLLHPEEGLRYAFDRSHIFGGNMSSLRLEYDVSSPEHNAFNGFYIKLPNQDLSKIEQFVFFVKGGERENSPPFYSKLPWVSQDPNAGYTRSFKIEFKDAQGNVAAYVVTGVKQEEWTPVVIKKEEMSNYREIDWKNIEEVNIVFADTMCLPDKDGVIYIAGLLNDPRQNSIYQIASDIHHMLTQFYEDREEEKRKFLTRFGIEGMNYVKMEKEDIEALCEALVENPDSILQMGAYELRDLISTTLPDISIEDLIEALLIPEILSGNLTTQEIREGFRLNPLKLVRFVNQRSDFPLFVVKGENLGVLKTDSEISELLMEAISSHEDLAQIVEFLKVNGVALNEVDFSPDAVVPSLIPGVGKYVVQLTPSAETLRRSVPFIAQLGIDGTQEYVVVTDVKKKRILGKLSPVYIEYIDSEGRKHTESWREFNSKWLNGYGLGLLPVPIIAVLEGGEYFIIDKVTSDEVRGRVSDGERIYTREEFERMMGGQILSLTRPIGDTIPGSVIRERLIEKARAAAEENLPVHQPENWYHYPDGLPYTAYNSIQGDVFYKDEGSWLQLMPRGGTNIDPLKVYFYTQSLNQYVEIPYIISQYNYDTPEVLSWIHYLESLGEEDVRVPTDPYDLPPDTQYTADLRLGHMMNIGVYPLVLDVSGNGYVRFTAFPPLIMGASLRFGFHNVGGKVLGNPDEEDFYKITECYVRKVDENTYNILLLLNAQDYTGVLDINFVPGEEANMHVKATYFPKRDISMEEEPNTGFIGFSSMFYKGSKDTPDNPNDQAHDSDYFIVKYADGTIQEQPLFNPTQPTLISFAQGDTVGISLEQRERNPEVYLEYPGDEFYKRCSYDIDILNSSVPLVPKLYIFPTSGITVDNVAVFLAVSQDLHRLKPITIEYTVKARR